MSIPFSAFERALRAEMSINFISGLPFYVIILRVWGGLGLNTLALGSNHGDKQCEEAHEVGKGRLKKVS